MNQHEHLLDGMTITPYRPQPSRVIGLLVEALSETSEQKGFKSRAGRLGSFNARVMDLDIGESCAKLRAVDPTCSVERLTAELQMMREQVRNATSPAVRNAKDNKQGASYSIEVGDLIMPSGALFVVAVVTRNA